MKTTLMGLIAGCLALAATPAWACSVPVFRYALERWQADPYQVVIFHRGELSAEQRSVTERLAPKGQAGKQLANIELRLVDLEADPAPSLLELWKSQQTETLPWMVVHYPRQTRISVIVWSGLLSDESVTWLLDSPLRRDVARRLLKGDSAVWVLLRSGDNLKDDAALNLLQQQLDHQQQTLKLPEIDAGDIAEGLVSIDPDRLQLAFSLVQLSRNDPAEKMLVEMLLGTEPGLTDDEPDLRNVTEPMAFPIFGRGRVLYALIGAGINQETIATAALDLTGPCTCTVKDQNPGVDLVMSVNWDALVEERLEIDKALPPLVALGSFVPQVTARIEANPTGGPLSETVDSDTPQDELCVVETETDSKDSTALPAENVPRSISPLLRNLLIVGGLAAIGIVVGSFSLTRIKS